MPSIPLRRIQNLGGGIVFTSLRDMPTATIFGTSSLAAIAKYAAA